jgi:hypothetical protein
MRRLLPPPRLPGVSAGHYPADWIHCRLRGRLRAHELGPIFAPPPALQPARQQLPRQFHHIISASSRNGGRARGGQQRRQCRRRRRRTAGFPRRPRICRGHVRPETASNTTTAERLGVSVGCHRFYRHQAQPGQHLCGQVRLGAVPLAAHARSHTLSPIPKRWHIPHRLSAGGRGDCGQGFMGSRSGQELGRSVSRQQQPHAMEHVRRRPRAHRWASQRVCALLPTGRHKRRVQLLYHHHR